MQLKPTVFVSPDYRYVCDTCEPLKKAISEKSIEWIGFKRGLYPGDFFDSDEMEGLRLLAYWNSKNSQNWGLNFHRNEGLEIGFVESGVAEFSTEKKLQNFSSLTPEFVTITKPWQEHKIGNPNLTACKMYFIIIDVGVRRPNQDWKWPNWILLSKSDKAEFAKYMQNTSNSIFKSTPEIKSAFVKIGKILSSKDMFDVSKLSLLINSIFLELLNVFRGDTTDYSESSPNENVVKCFIEQLPAYCNQAWTLESMAEDCGLKPTRFSYYCRLLTNMTPIELLTQARLERAKKMLEEDFSDKTITEIAFDCGFTSSQYFSTKFREQYGNSPRSIRLKESPNK